jgi:hypothetical protein
MAFCKHLCPKQCHPDNGHYYCGVAVHSAQCDQGHLVNSECSAPRDMRPCKRCEDVVQREQEHQARLTAMREKHEQDVADLKRNAQAKEHETQALKEKYDLDIKKEEEAQKAKIRRAEAQKEQDGQKRAAEAKKEAIAEQTRREIERVRHSPDKRCIRRDLRKDHPKDKPDYIKVVDRVEKYVQHAHGIDMTVTRIEEITNGKLEEEWYKSYFGLVGSGTEPEFLFHGTSVEGVKGITENGFRLPTRSPNNMFGAGVYFATDSSKSAQQLYTKGSCMLLLCQVRNPTTI